MKLTGVKINIETRNSAFTEFPEIEVARILRELADKTEANGVLDSVVRDINGNRVGFLTIEEDFEDEEE